MIDNVIEDILSLRADISALNTLIFDAVTHISSLRETEQVYELERLKNVFTPTFYMIDKKLQEIDKLATDFLDQNMNKGVDDGPI
ncbi:hypothetical protein [Pseudolactococcus piscium]|uniref:hypothetical protein n=1 Tax=Pseudolactococcus piscium TaxID=1364 RepID=UPI000BDEF439|nr:hypothetical protein [Lactococcus piscium]